MLAPRVRICTPVVALAMAALALSLAFAAGARADAGVMSQGFQHGCGITINSTVKCWGSNASGQLGDGNFSSDWSTAVDVSGIASGATGVSAGYAHSCAIVNDAAKCWGSNLSLQLGTAAGAYSGTPVQVDGLTSGVTDLDAGYSHTCAVVSAAAKCWGYNGSGGLGNDNNVDSQTPVDVFGLGSGVTAISAGQDFTCAVHNGAAKCWGWGGAGQLGDGNYTNSDRPVQVAGLTSGVTAISAGGYHACAVQNGALKCWGVGFAGQLGDSTGIDSGTPVDVTGMSSGVSRVAAGEEHTCAVQSGAAFCWGSAGLGQLGNGTNPSSATSPQAVSNLGSPVTVITSGTNGSCAVGGGAAKCWGDSQFGQLGLGFDQYQRTPVTISGGASGVSAISAGGDHACAVISSAAQCWGVDNNQQLGNGAGFVGSFIPQTAVGLGSSVTAVSAGQLHSCAIVNSTAKCWGHNNTGQLGDGSITMRPSPVDVYFDPMPTAATAISAGASHTCGIFDGTVWCWGSRADYRLGAGSNSGNSSTPVNTGLTNAIAVSAGDNHTCAIVTGGAVYCWGDNSNGQIGNSGNPTDAQTPTLVPTISSGATAIDAGANATCAVVSGATRCWGLNSDGKLGDGTSTQRNAPVNVSGMTTGSTAVTAGAIQGCAVQSGAAKCWGNNGFGNLGDGTTTSSSTPVSVSGMNSGVTALAAGDSFTCAIQSGAGKCWGWRDRGKVGDGHATYESTPSSVLNYAPFAPDATPPEISDIDPADGTITNQASVTLTYTVTDNADPSPDCSPASGSTVPLSPGVNTIEINCTDAAANPAQASVTVTLDNQQPTVTVTSPADNLFTQNASVTLTYSVSDDHDASPSCDKASGSSQSLDPGINTISVTCTDEAGNSRTVSRTVTRDNTAPSVTITAPADGHFTQNANVNVAYTVNDAIDATPTCNFASGSSRPLDPGSNTITVTCSDDAGNSGSASITVTRDSTVPAVNITAPANNFATQAGFVVVDYTVSDSDDPAPDCSVASGEIHALAEGPNTITVSCTDLAGNTGQASINVIRDTAAPSVSITAPADNHFTNAESVNVFYNVGDALDATPTCNFASGSTRPLNPGSNTITVTCSDDAGNTGSASITVTSDSSSPTVTIDSPADGLSTQDGVVTLDYTVSDASPYSCDVADGELIPLAAGSNTITVTCTDAAGNVGSSSVTVVRDNAQPSLSITSPANGHITNQSEVVVTYLTSDAIDPSPSCNFASGHSHPLVPGENTITITCADAAGNSRSQSISVTLDATAPTITITTPADGLHTKDTSVVLSFTASDNLDTELSCNKTSGSSQPLFVGSNTISVTCSDDAGNSTTESRSVVRDTGLPVITVTSPANNLQTNAESVDLVYSVSDDNDPSPSCDKASGSSQPLSVGSNTISVTCTDDALNSATVSRTVIRDVEGPQITITSPADNLQTASGNVTLNYTVSDNHDASPSCDKASGSSQSLIAGSNTITVTCEDDAGNETVASRTVIRDNTDPVITVTSPANGAVTAASSVTLTYSVSDDFDASPDCDVPSGTSVGLSEGLNSVSVTCTDAAGNDATVSRSVTRDNTAPSVTITAPADGTQTSAASIAVTYTVSDAVDASPSCTIASGASVALSMGANTITVSCNDDVGNTGSASVSVTRVTDGPPSVTITSPVNGSATKDASVTLSFTASDDNGTPSCNRTSGASVALNPGVNTISVTCTDSASQQTTASVTVTRDNTAPTVTITAPADNFVTNLANVVLSFTVSDALDASPSCDKVSGSSQPLSSGSNTISVTCEDDAGNQTTASRTVVRDNVAPTITVTSPANNLHTQNSSVTLTYTVSDAIDATPNCTAASGSVHPLVAGSNTISVTCSDDAGNSSTVSLTVIRDNTVPSVTITSPADGFSTAAASVVVNYTVSDALDATPTCTFASGSSRPLSTGANTITVSCDDDAGNTGTASISVTRVTDNPPSVTITSPVNGSATQSSSVTLHFTASDDNGTPSCNRTDGESVALVSGPNTISVTCTDSASQPTTASVTVTRDNVAPSVTVTSPADNLVTQANSVVLNFTVSDALDASPSCNKVNGTTQPLLSGSNTISVTCTDDAGNETTVSRSVTRDTEAPAVMITAPVDGSTTTETSVTLEFTASDNIGTPSCTRTSGDTVDLNVGANEISVTCTDSVGNETTATVDVTRTDPDGGGPTNPPTQPQPPVDPGTQAKPADSVTPSLIFARKAKVRRKVATVTARVWFMIPGKRASEGPCTGVVTGTTRPKGVRKTLKSTRGLRADGAACIADLKFKLPKKLVGKKISVKLSFPGNSVVAPFGRTVKHKVK